jgi:uncharacterized cofD-like protein
LAAILHANPAMNIVCVGGGTGLPTLLKGVSQICHSPGGDEITLTAVVCVSDNGGSSGTLRQSFGIPAVGDLRNCLVALASGGSPLGDLFQHRLSRGNGLSGHALGNLVVTALCERTGSLLEAIRQAADLLQSCGHVLPSTEQPVTLCAEFEDRAIVRGEVQIAGRRGRIARVWLEPREMRPTPGLVSAILTADMVVFGPGSLYTSIIPNLLVTGIAEAVRRSEATKVYVCNLMTQPGETDGFTACDHLRELERYCGEGTIDACVLNSGRVSGKDGGHAVENDVEAIMRHGTVPVVADLLIEGSSEVRHDSAKLAAVIAMLGRERESQFEEELAAAG